MCLKFYCKLSIGNVHIQSCIRIGEEHTCFLKYEYTTGFVTCRRFVWMTIKSCWQLRLLFRIRAWPHNFYKKKVSHHWFTILLYDCQVISPFFPSWTEIFHLKIAKWRIVVHFCATRGCTCFTVIKTYFWDSFQETSLPGPDRFSVNDFWRTAHSWNHTSLKF